MCLWIVLLYRKKVGITTKSMRRTKMLRIMMARGDMYETNIINDLISIIFNKNLLTKDVCICISIR